MDSFLLVLVVFFAIGMISRWNRVNDKFRHTKEDTSPKSFEVLTFGK